MVEVAFHTTADLHVVLAFVDAEKAPYGHISFGILGDDLQAELQNSRACFVQNGIDFMAHKQTKMLDPIEETLLPVAACV